jgi:hypothetical protein
MLFFGNFITKKRKQVEQMLLKYKEKYINNKKMYTKYFYDQRLLIKFSAFSIQILKYLFLMFIQIFFCVNISIENIGQKAYFMCEGK